MPESLSRKNISLFNDAFVELQAKYQKESPDTSFVRWTSNFIITALQKERYLSEYFSNLHKIGFTNNILYIENTKEDKIVKVSMVNGVLKSSDADPIYLQYAISLPDIVKLKEKS